MPLPRPSTCSGYTSLGSWSMILVQHLWVLKVHLVLTLRSTFWTRKHGSQDGEAACPRVFHRGRLGQMDAVCPGPLDLLHFMQHRRRHPGLLQCPQCHQNHHSTSEQCKPLVCMPDSGSDLQRKRQGGAVLVMEASKCLGSWNP